MRCPVHGYGYGRCLGCIMEAMYGIRHIEAAAAERASVSTWPAGSSGKVAKPLEAPPAIPDLTVA